MLARLSSVLTCKRTYLNLIFSHAVGVTRLHPLAIYQPDIARSFAAQALLVVHPRHQPAAQVQEALRLAETYAGGRCRGIAVGPVQGFTPAPGAYFRAGAVTELKGRLASDPAKMVFVNAILSGVQQRNLESAWGLPVLDRVGLIIGIFAQRARSREARLQVEMASLTFKASRLVRGTDAMGRRAGFGKQGQTEVVSARERGRSGGTSGGLGGSGGGGETELQLQRRRIRTRIATLNRQLAEVRRTRAVQRAGRLRAGKPVCAVVGYTNAGKSSLVSALSGKDVGVEDRLFETLDPTLRQVRLPSGRAAILSDTVGFISNLPTPLIKAFQATLEEVVEADLLLHVMDGASAQMQQQREAVLGVLRQIGVPESRLRSRMIEVINKADLLGAAAEAAAAGEGVHASASVPCVKSSAAAAPACSTRTASPSSSSSSMARHAACATGGNGWCGMPEAEGEASAASRVVTSALSGLGLDELLVEIDAKVGELRSPGEATDGPAPSDACHSSPQNARSRAHAALQAA